MPLLVSITVTCSCYKIGTFRTWLGQVYFTNLSFAWSNIQLSHIYSIRCQVYLVNDHTNWHHFFSSSCWLVTVRLLEVLVPLWTVCWEEAEGKWWTEFVMVLEPSFAAACWEVCETCVDDGGDDACSVVVVDGAWTRITDCSLSALLWLWVSPSSSTLNWNLSSSSSCLLQKLEEGEIGIDEWYQSRLSSKVSRISCASGYTRSAHVSHKGCTM